MKKVFNISYFFLSTDFLKVHAKTCRWRGDRARRERVRDSAQVPAERSRPWSTKPLWRHEDKPPWFRRAQGTAFRPSPNHVLKLIPFWDITDFFLICNISSLVSCILILDRKNVSFIFCQYLLVRLVEARDGRGGHSDHWAATTTSANFAAVRLGPADDWLD
jgi:hypothetical protein